VTATADRYAAGRSREELRLVELASGLLLLLDAYRLTGRLPLEVQVQASRLRHAVKLAVQAEAARTTTLPPTPPPAGRDQTAALRAWIATQPWIQPGPQGWVYLLCFRDPATGAHRPLRGNGCRGQYAGHYWGKPASSGFLRVVWRVGSAGFAELAWQGWLLVCLCLGRSYVAREYATGPMSREFEPMRRAAFCLHESGLRHFLGTFGGSGSLIPPQNRVREQLFLATPGTHLSSVSAGRRSFSALRAHVTSV
jgi:hypothetical protein